MHLCLIDFQQGCQDNERINSLFNKWYRGQNEYPQNFEFEPLSNHIQITESRSKT